MDILEELRSKFNLSDDMIAKAREHMDANGGQLPDWVQEKAGGLLDMIPGGFGDKLGDMLGIETAADHTASDAAEASSETN